jgi:hypothetical protein
MIPGIEWQKTIGGSQTEWLEDFHQTTDGGYIFVGTSSSNICDDKSEDCIGICDYWLTKTDAYGTIEWENTIGGDLWDIPYCVQQTTDGGYILGGESESNISGDKSQDDYVPYDIWLVKTGSDGVIEWQRTYLADESDELYSIQQTKDDGYILGATSMSNQSGDKSENGFGGTDYWVIKINATGEIQWQHTYGDYEGDYLSTVRQTKDGGYIIGGSAHTYFFGELDYWIIKLNSAGHFQWERSIGGSSNDYFRDLQQTDDGGYILGGMSASPVSGVKTDSLRGWVDYWIVKIDSNGTVQWDKTIGGTNEDDLSSVRQTVDGGYIVGGTSFSVVSGDKTSAGYGWSDYWIVKLDGSGNIEWQDAQGGDRGETLSAIIPTNDGGYLVGGYSSSDSSGTKTDDCKGPTYPDYWIVKLLGPDNTGSTLVNEDFSAITVAPNPFDQDTKVSFSNPLHHKIKVEIKNIAGKTLQTIFTSDDHVIVRRVSFHESIYFAQVLDQTTGQRVTLKLVTTN